MRLRINANTGSLNLVRVTVLFEAEAGSPFEPTTGLHTIVANVVDTITCPKGWHALSDLELP